MFGRNSLSNTVFEQLKKIKYVLYKHPNNAERLNVLKNMFEKGHTNQFLKLDFYFLLVIVLANFTLFSVEA